MGSRGRTLTFGDDGSTGADRAWGWIAAHAWPDWSVEVVTAGRSDAERQPQESSRPRFAPARCRLRSVDHLVAEGDPRVVLAERPQSDLLVVGARGAGLLKALRVGSTAEWLLRCPAHPLVIARRSQVTRSVMVCVDGSGHADAAVRFLASLPWVTRASITVLGVAQWEDDIAAVVADAARMLTAAGANAAPLVVEPDRVGVTVSPALTIFEHVDARKPDLVVLGTAGRTGLARLWVGSVASAVARHARASVLLVRDTAS